MSQHRRAGGQAGASISQAQCAHPDMLCDRLCPKAKYTIHRYYAETNREATRPKDRRLQWSLIQLSSADKSPVILNRKNNRRANG